MTESAVAVRSVYIDANIIIIAFEGTGEAVRLAASGLLDAASAGAFVPVTSDLTFSEILVGPLRSQNGPLIEIYERMFAPASPFRIVPVTRNRWREAAQLRARFPALKLADAVHMACCMAAKCDVLVMDDRRFPNGYPIPIRSLSVTILDEIRAL